MTLAAHAPGYGAIWRTGPHLDLSLLRETTGLDGHETPRGRIYVGSSVAV
ncbi:hypothetical protein [Streptomyces bacillaris]